MALKDLELIHDGSRFLIYLDRELSELVKVAKNPNPRSDEQALLHNEYRISKTLDIPGVRNVLREGRMEDRPVLFLEFLEGQSMRELLTADDFNFKDKLNFAIQLTDILADVHRRGVIHNDLSSNNVLARGRGAELKVLLIDFGYAKFYSRESQRSSSVMKGTLAYLPPEQSGRVSYPIDQRSDLYSLGILLYELFGKQLPFEFETKSEMLHAHLARKPISLHKVNPEVPGQLSFIIKQLLAKHPDERYDQADGLAKDLRMCLKQWSEESHIEPFALAKHSLKKAFQISDKIYEREAQLETLTQTFEAFQKGASVFTIIEGEKGNGKSKIINEFRKKLPFDQVYCSKGSFEQVKSDDEFAAIFPLVRDLVRQILTESGQELEAWKRRILDALADNAFLLCDKIPDLELVIGNHIKPSDFVEAEATDRLTTALLNLLYALSRSQRRLIVFFDDAQWMDKATENLMKLILQSPIFERLWVVLAQTPDSTHQFAALESAAPASPISNLNETLEKSDKEINRISLHNLSEEGVKQMLVDTLGREVDSQELAVLLYGKTKGNFCFLEEYLFSLYKNSSIRHDAQAHWIFDLQAVRQLAISENVVPEVLAQRTHFPAKVQQAVEMASCIGGYFSFKILQAICPEDCDKLEEHLQAAAKENSLVELTETEEPENKHWGFTHEKVRQAFYEQIDQGRLPTIHFAIAKEMAKPYVSCKKGELPAKNIFEIVDHWNLGFELVQTREDRRSLAEYNLQAGKLMSTKSKWKAALNYFQTGMDLLAHYGWENNYTLNHAMNTEAIKVASLSGEYKLLTSLADRQIRQAVNLVDKAEAYELKIQALIAQNKMEEALKQGLGFMKQLGLTFPNKLNKTTQTMGAFRTQFLLRGKTPERLLDLPRMTDVRKLAAMRMLAVVMPAARITQVELVPFLVFEQLHLSLKYGNSPLSPFAYMGYAGIIYQGKKDIDESSKFGQLAMDLLDRFEAEEYKSRLHYLFYGIFGPLKISFKDLISPLEKAWEIGMHTGDHTSAGLAIGQSVFYDYLSGSPLPGIQASIQRHLDETQGEGKTASNVFMNLAGSVLEDLTAEADSCSLLKDLDGEIGESGVSVWGRPFDFAFRFNKMVLAMLFEYKEEAMTICRQIEEIPPFIGFSSNILSTFYGGLVRLNTARDAKKKKRKKLLAQVQKDLDLLSLHSLHSPVNFLQKFYLLNAEYKRTEGDDKNAREYYDKAIQAARDHENLFDEALALELGGSFYRDLGNRFLAEAFLLRAWQTYTSWGATAKANQLEKRYPYFIGKSQNEGSNSSVSSDSQNSLSSVDLENITKASVALSGEVVLSNLLEKLMKIVLEMTGAQRGFFIEKRDGDSPMILAKADSAARYQTSIEMPLEKETEIAHSVVHYVMRSSEIIMLDNASESQAYRNDPHIISASSASLMCYPIVRKGKLLAVIYLENVLTKAAFSSEHLASMKMLSTQIGISLENARLYENLDEKVRVRTQELFKKNEELGELVKRLQETQSQLVQSEKMASLGQLTAGVAHEINNPINFVSANIGPLSRDIADIKELYLKVQALEESSDIKEGLEKIREYREEIDADFLFEEIELLLKGIKDGAMRTKEIVVGLKNFSRLDEESFKNADIHEGIDSTLTLLNSKLKNRIELHKDYGSIPRIDCLPGKLNQVFMNVLSNAMQALEDHADPAEKGIVGNIWIKTCLKYEAEDADSQRLIISIRDDGPGMPEEVSKRIFEPFFTTKEVGEGTGLGLSISYGIIQKHNGELSVKSEVGTGTEFLIDIPVLQ